MYKNKRNLKKNVLVCFYSSITVEPIKDTAVPIRQTDRITDRKIGPTRKKKSNI